MQLTLIKGDSGTSLTIGAGPVTGRIKVNGTHTPVGNFGLPLKKLC